MIHQKDGGQVGKTISHLPREIEDKLLCLTIVYLENLSKK